MQQINLYLPEFRPKRQPVRAAHMAWALVAVALLLVAATLWSFGRTNALERQLAEADAKLQEQQAQVAQLQSLASPGPSANLESEIAVLKQDVRRRERIKSLMTQQNLGNAEGFSEQMEGLARQSPDGLALERISLQSGGGYVELGGRVRSADLVPLYLQRLRQESSFARTRFGVLDVGRDDAPAQSLVFTLARAQGEGNP